MTSDFQAIPTQANPLKQFILFGLLSSMFTIFFLVIYIISRQIYADPIVYYNGNKIVFLSAFLFLLAGLFLHFFVLSPKKWKTLRSVYLQSLFCFILLGYSFVITIPSLLDRSISIYVISTIAQAGPTGIPLDEMQDIFLRGYIDGTTTVEKRLNEQIVSKDVEKKDNRFFITSRGMFVYRTNLFLGKLFNIPDKYLIALNGTPKSKDSKP